MAVIGGYIFLGSLLFGLWEGWKPLEASYFCFVTIATIGFGDLVPGAARFENVADQYKMIASAFYMLFGNKTTAWWWNVVTASARLTVVSVTNISSACER